MSQKFCILSATFTSVKVKLQTFCFHLPVMVTQTNNPSSVGTAKGAFRPIM